MEVSAPPGNPIGSIQQEWSMCSPAFSIKNHSGETVLRIEGPFCTFSLCGDVDFRVRNGSNAVFWENFRIIFCLSTDSHLKREWSGQNFKTMVRFDKRNVHRCRFLRYHISNGFGCPNESGHVRRLLFNRKFAAICFHICMYSIYPINSLLNK